MNRILHTTFALPALLAVSLNVGAELIVNEQIIRLQQPAPVRHTGRSVSPPVLVLFRRRSIGAVRTDHP